MSHRDDYSDAELADLLKGAARTLAREPSQAAEATRLAAIGESLADRDAARQEAGRRGTLSRIVDRARYYGLRVVAAGALLAGSSVGLAYAGVNLPGTAAEKALETVTGLDLPNQSDESHGKSDEEHGAADEDHGKDDEEANENSGNDVSDAVHDVKDGDEDRGCEFGQAVADAAHDANAGESNANGSEKEKCDNEGGGEGNAFGHDKDHENNGHENNPSAGSKSQGDDHRNEGGDKPEHEAKVKEDHEANANSTEDHDPNENSSDHEPKAEKDTGKPDEPPAKGQGRSDDDDTETDEAPLVEESPSPATEG